MTVNLRSHNKGIRNSAAKAALRYRVIADGRDVTNRCFYFDGRRRIVGLNLHDTKGMAYLNENREVATEFIHPRRARLVKK